MKSARSYRGRPPWRSKGTTSRSCSMRVGPRSRSVGRTRADPARPPPQSQPQPRPRPPHPPQVSSNPGSTKRADWTHRTSSSRLAGRPSFAAGETSPRSRRPPSSLPPCSPSASNSSAPTTAFESPSTAAQTLVGNVAKTVFGRMWSSKPTVSQSHCDRSAPPPPRCTSSGYPSPFISSRNTATAWS